MGENIPHYINDPVINAATAPELKLYRPRISFWKTGLYIFAHLFLALLISIVWAMIARQSFSFSFDDLFPKIWICLAILFALSLRFSLIWFVRVYQHYAKSETRLRCCMTPSCSEYAILAFKKYGAIIGCIKTFGRLLRCHPPGGIDYP